MPNIFIDGKSYEVKNGVNLLHAALSLGFDLPYFCWHPALGSVGACRQCAVKQFKDEQDTRGRIVMACMTPANEGSLISIEDHEAREFRASVIEWLMTNHPHDCPVCDEGGECHLQDMTVMSGHNYRHYRFEKRTHVNQYLGPFVNHEMNRCIACYRCVRYYNDYAGGHDLSVFASHNNVYFGRATDGILESEFSGNLVEVCPTGVFTDKTLGQHYTRKWDLQHGPSICHHCSIGCNISAGERYGTLRRIVNRFNDEVNGYFLCDRGRFGYEFVNSEKRLRKPRAATDVFDSDPGTMKELVLERIRELIGNRGPLVGIGSPRASVESNYALRALVGPEHFYSGTSATEAHLTAKIINILKRTPLRSASLRDIERSDAVVIFGEDINNTAPMAALAVRQSTLQQPKQQAAKLRIPAWDDYSIREHVQKQNGPLYIATPVATRLDEIAAGTLRAAPDDIALFAAGIARELDNSAPSPQRMPDAAAKLVKDAAAALRSAERPLIVTGISLLNEAIIETATNIALALLKFNPATHICFLLPECNGMGAALLGGKPLGDLFRRARNGEIGTAIILENDLYRRAERPLVNEFFGAVDQTIIIDAIETPSTEHASIVLPAATFAEGSGTLINYEGRAQRFFDVVAPTGPIQEGWRWVRDIMSQESSNGAPVWNTLDDVFDAIAGDFPMLAKVVNAAPESGFRITGQKIARETHRFSGRTAMYANQTMFEPRPPNDPDAPLTHSMEGYYGPMPSSLMPFFWAPGWNSIQSTNKYQQEVGSMLTGGTAGIRLFEPDGAGTSDYFQNIPDPFSPSRGEIMIVPLYHVFGSEEMSMLSPGIAALAPKPYVAVSQADAEALYLSEGSILSIPFGSQLLELPVTIYKEMPAGVMGIPVGLPGIGHFSLPTRINLRQEKTA